ncbi:hypothetical protein [Sphingomonas parapaucimobilis]|jgi:hypothetical protein|uniref:hypothetical protein n=1 Tax=Sphingomonas parapaucimobilis TaxID=28213 RepID=UPI00391C2C45
MIEWFRARARQERSFAQRATTFEARAAHKALMAILVRHCASQPALRRSLCRHCPVQVECRRAALLVVTGRIAA